MFTIDPRQAAKVAIPDTGQKTLFLDESDSILKTKDDAGVVESLAVADATEPKVYIALLTQSNTDAPTATVLKNTLGGELVWTRDDTGNYFGTLLNAFIGYTNIENINRSTFTRLISDDGTGPVSRGYWMFKDSINAVYLKTTSDTETYADDILTQTYIKIEVYP